MDLRTHLTTVGGTPVVVVDGVADLSSIPLLHDQLSRAISEHDGVTVMVDLDQVRALDDVALGVLLGAAGRAREAGGDIELVCSTERLRRRFEVTGLDRAITLHRSLGASS